jgi:nicotinate-nucleotide adenylyltransferase
VTGDGGQFQSRATGILGGTFNPPHAGHVALARHARAELGLEALWLMPLHTPPHKPAEEDPGPERRLEMCRLAVEGEPGIEACGLEVRRGGPSYTADTLSEIHASNPEADLTFVMGADTALTLPSWRDPARVLELARLAVARRPGSDGVSVLDALSGIAGADPRVVFLEMEPIEASSSLARERLAAGESTDGLLSDAVRSYIERNGLYGTPAGAAR